MEQIFEYNIAMNMHSQRLHPKELVLAILVFLDEEQREIVINIAKNALKPYGHDWYVKYT